MKVNKLMCVGGVCVVVGLVCVGVFCWLVGRSRPPLHRFTSPNGVWEVCTYGENLGFHIKIERVVITRGGLVVGELRHPVDEPIAIVNDGSLYLGSYSGHLHELRAVYVYRDGKTAYLGDVPFPGFEWIPHDTRKGQTADHWQEWERQMKALPGAGPACCGLRLLAKPAEDVFAAKGGVRIELALHNVALEVVLVPRDLPALIRPLVLDCPGDQKLLQDRWHWRMENPDAVQTHTIAPDAAARSTFDLGELLPGEYRFRIDMDQSWRKDVLGQSRWRPLPSNEIGFTVR